MNATLKSLLLGSAATGSTVFETVYALFRFYCGISIAIGAGLMKTFHKIDENGPVDWSNIAFGVPEWFVQQVGGLGFTFISPQFWAILATYGELVGGLLIAVGLFTRISAIQMAFQFFVVSFLWYKAPMPFAMYYQQLIFWSFVMIAAVGNGRYALANLAIKRRTPVFKPAVALLVLGLCANSHNSFAQTNASPSAIQLNNRVSFSLSNPSLKGMNLDIRCFDYTKKERIGYGCRLGALQSRSDNKPVGTRIYIKKEGKWLLKYVLGAGDDGKKIDLTKEYEISREQWQQVAYDEQNEATAALEDLSKNPDMEAVAAQLGLEMVTFKVGGKSPFGKQIHVRAQLPYETERSNNGFSRKLSFWKTYRVSYPVGTKIYLCEGPYWNGPVAETLLLTLIPEKANYTVKL